LRCLSAVGHKISLGSIISSLLSKRNKHTFLHSWIDDEKVFFLSSGSAALILSLKSLKQISKRKKVIFPAYTCPSILTAIVKNDLTPVICDIDRNGFNMNLNQLRSKIDKNTLAVIAVHLYGLPENIYQIKELTEKENVFLVEDAAQAFGNDLDSKPLGHFGDLSVLSFDRGKPMNLLSGGAIVVNAPQLTEIVVNVYKHYKPVHPLVFNLKYYILLVLYSFLFHPRMFWIPQALPWLKIGETNFTLDVNINHISPPVLKLGQVIRRKFTDIKNVRLELIRQYKEIFHMHRHYFSFQHNDIDKEIILLRYPVVLRSKKIRDETLKILQKKGLGASGSYPAPINELNVASSYFKSSESYPNAKFISERIMTLPLHENVKPVDIELMASIISSIQEAI